MLNVALIVLFALIIVVGAVSYYVIYAGLSPVEANMEEKYNYMYSEYPFLHRWVDSLNRHKALRDTVIYAPDSTKLHAYFIQAPKQTVNTAVIVHGHRCCAVDMFHIAYMYNHDMKFNVLLPDLRAHGDSEGTHEQMGWLDRLDVMQWMEVANKRFGGATKMVVHGISMGAATTMMVSGEANQPEYVKCYVEDCGYTDVWDEFSYVAKHDYHIPAFPFINIASHICKWKYGWDFKEASAINQVKKCTKPMLFIHGMSDTYVPTEMVYRLYSAKAKDKSIWTKRGVMHARMYHDYPKEYTHEVSQFVNMWFYKK
ncbi:MAG: alpha/beta hydrolase [Bacteroidaceae bacterium]|nr:alpha/beta hydrolase [Bacteroidaceae bacterium]